MALYSMPDKVRRSALISALQRWRRHSDAPSAAGVVRAVNTRGTRAKTFSLLVANIDHLKCERPHGRNHHDFNERG